MGRRVAIERMTAAINELLESGGVAFEEIPIIGLATPGTMDLECRDDPRTTQHAGLGAIPDPRHAECGLRQTGQVLQRCDRGRIRGILDRQRQEYELLVLLTLGTGIGAGIVMEGRTIDGHHSHGAENGHTLIDISSDSSHLRLWTTGAPGGLCQRDGDRSAHCRGWTRVGRARCGRGPLPAKKLTHADVAEEAEQGTPCRWR